jgi:hypothetical protein
MTIKHIQKTFKPSLADFAAAHRRLKLQHIAYGKHETEMIRRALTLTDAELVASFPAAEVKVAKPEPQGEAA